MTAQIIVCQACNAEVHGEIYHLGFCDMQALYCSSCPKVLLLKDRELLPSNGISWPNFTAADPGFEFYDRHLLQVYASIEALFNPCECGGRYLYMAPPHCPKCGGLLRGDCYEDKPILKERDGYVFVSAGSVTDHEQLKQLA